MPQQERLAFKPFRFKQFDRVIHLRVLLGSDRLGSSDQRAIKHPQGDQSGEYAGHKQAQPRPPFVRRKLFADRARMYCFRRLHNIFRVVLEQMGGLNSLKCKYRAKGGQTVVRNTLYSNAKRCTTLYE